MLWKIIFNSWILYFSSVIGFVAIYVSFWRSGAIQKQSAQYGQGSGNIVLDDVNCRGPETFIRCCVHNGYMVHNCNHGEDVGVVCCMCFFCNFFVTLYPICH